MHQIVIQRSADRSDIRLIAVDGTQANGLRLQQDTDLHKRIEIEAVNLEDVVNLVHQHRHGVVGKYSSALRIGLDNAIYLKALDGTAHMSTAYTDIFGKLALSRQAIAGLERTGLKQMKDMQGDFALLRGLGRRFGF